MARIPRIIRLKPHEPTLQRRFLTGVLIPPFVILVILGLLMFWQLDRIVKQQAVTELNRAASTTAAKLEREFAIRETVLKQTGADLFNTKTDYQETRTQLDANRTACSTHVKAKRTFKNSPNNVCDDFLSEFAKQGSTTQAVEDGYTALVTEQDSTLKENIANHLVTYQQFFPETLALLVVDEDNAIVSKAFSGDYTASEDELVEIVSGVKEKSVHGKVISVEDTTAAVFAYPISGGAVLAAYSTVSESFLKQSWESTPIDSQRELAVILDGEGELVYPSLTFSDAFTGVNEHLTNNQSTEISLKNITHIATGDRAGTSDWMVVVASPKAVVLSAVRDAQLVAVIIIGTLLVGFLWVGAYFIDRTVKGIMRLVGGAVIFTGGNLDYRIKMDRSDIEFARLAETMNNMAERIAAAEKELDERNKEFISIASHELRTPLTAIKGNLSIAFEDMGDQLSDSVKPIVAEAFKSTTRLATLVNDMLDMARLDGNRVEFVIGPQDMKARVSDVVDSLRVTANEKPVNLTYNDAGAKSVMADESKLGIILNNFVSNAIKYNRAGGTVTISHSLQEDQLVTAIADTGLGIPEDQKAHMFEKFFRVQNEDRKAVVGTGLGMYITREYIVKMGGKIWFESTHGQGTTFYFSLPIARAVDV